MCAYLYVRTFGSRLLGGAGNRLYAHVSAVVGAWWDGSPLLRLLPVEIGEPRVPLLAPLDRQSCADASGALCLQHFCSQSGFPENSVRISVWIWVPRDEDDGFN